MLASLACSHARPAVSEPFVPGELIVLFAPGSEQQEQVARAAAQPTPDVDRLQPIASRLGSAIGAPLHVQRLGSGGMVIMSIDADAMRERIGAALTAANAFPGARVERPPRTREQPAGPDLIVRPATAEPIAPAEVEKRLAPVREQLRVPLTAQATADGAITVLIQWNELTRTVAERLRHQPSVTEVELNTVVFPYGPPSD
jgi:hypothetical protein